MFKIYLVGVKKKKNKTAGIIYINNNFNFLLS